MNEITIKVGKKIGSTSVIFAGIHGNEICGVEAFKKIIPKLNIDSGTVYFILGNPEAINKNKRYIEHNLNRLFKLDNKYSSGIKKTYEYKRAIYLKKFLKKADALLDIHSTTNKNLPFIICENRSLKVANYLPSDFKRIVHGFELLEAGGTDGYMLSSDKIGICVECGVHTDKKSVLVATRAITNFLQSQGHISKNNLLKVINRPKFKMDSIYYTKSSDFKLAKKFKDFEKIKKNQVIGSDGNEIIKTKRDSIIVFAHSCNKKGEEGFLLGHEI